MSLCPCGSGTALDACCEPIIAGKTTALTAEALMRARYTAHAIGSFKFLETSVHSTKREPVDEAKMRQWNDAVTWQGMEVHAIEGGGDKDDTGSVSFTAKYRVNGIDQELREDATFTRENGEWRYVAGDVHGHTPYRREAPKINRNAPCPCGSGKKHKKCCG